jgi:P4 family phage/plasmid primase-like protien
MAGNSIFNEHELSRFLSTRRAYDGPTATMTAMGTGGGKWNITDGDYGAFLDLLHDYLFVKRGRPMNFVERPRKNEPKPLLIDLDFRYPDDTSLTRRFNSDHVETFTQMIVEGLDFFFGLENYEELRFFTTLRPAPYSDKGKRKDGVHILCPDIALTNEKQSVLRKWLLSRNAVGVAFKDTDYTNADEDVYDESMTRQQGWIFYGESKPSIQPYELKYVFKYIPEEKNWIEEDPASYSPRDLIQLLSVRYEIVPDTNELQDGEPTEAYNTLHKTSFKAADTAVAAAAAPQTAEQTQEVVAQENSIIEAINFLYQGIPPTEQEKHMIRRFVMDCLKECWYEQYDKWIRVGWCLHNIEPSEPMFKLWMDFSAKSGKSGDNDLAKLRYEWFHGMRKRGDGPRLTERSLRKWARDDNPEVYGQIISESLYDYIREEVEPTHFHVAKLMRKIYGSNYIASINPKSTEWFKYDDAINMWRRLNQGIELKSKLSEEVANELSIAERRLQGQINGAMKAEVREIIEKKIQMILKVRIQLYNNGFTESTMKMASQLFCEEDFMDKLNMDPYLFGCKNGVLELRVSGEDGREHVVFRQGRPEDYVSFLAGQNYPDSEPIEYRPYDAADPVQAEIADFFEKLFPNAELRRYVIRLMASCLEGNNREQRYYTFIGVGSNGKSKIVELMRLTLGDYQTSLQSTVLTRKRPDSGAANPEIMAVKGRRFIYMQEPDDREPINTSRMKQFSGEDIVEARALYGDQQKFKMMGKMFMMCNRLPPVTTMDHGTWRRIRVIPFESKFVPTDHPDYIQRKANVFPIDYKLDDKLRNWREAMLSLLVHIYETEYIPNGLSPEPEIVMRASNKYKETFDVYARFKGERIREPKTSDEQLDCRTSPETTNKIKQIFNAWKKENLVNTLTADEMIKNLSNEYGDPEKGKNWPMIKVFGSDDDAAEWDKDHAIQP